MAPKVVDARKRTTPNPRFRGHGPLLQKAWPTPGLAAHARAGFTRGSPLVRAPRGLPPSYRPPNPSAFECESSYRHPSGVKSVPISLSTRRAAIHALAGSDLHLAHFEPVARRARAAELVHQDLVARGAAFQDCRPPSSRRWMVASASERLRNPTRRSSPSMQTVALWIPAMKASSPPTYCSLIASSRTMSDIASTRTAKTVSLDACGVAARRGAGAWPDDGMEAAAAPHAIESFDRPQRGQRACGDGHVRGPRDACLARLIRTSGARVASPNRRTDGIAVPHRSRRPRAGACGRSTPPTPSPPPRSAALPAAVVEHQMFVRARPPQPGQVGSAPRHSQASSSMSGTSASAGQTGWSQFSRHSRWWMEP